MAIEAHGLGHPSHYQDRAGYQVSFVVSTYVQVNVTPIGDLDIVRRGNVARALHLTKI